MSQIQWIIYFMYSIVYIQFFFNLTLKLNPMIATQSVIMSQQ